MEFEDCLESVCKAESSGHIWLVSAVLAECKINCICSYVGLLHL